MEKNDVIELSHSIKEGEEHFKLKTSVDDVRTLFPDIKVRNGVWYIAGEVTYCTHVGTHIEVPYHHLKEGQDTSEFPVHDLIGNCVVLNFINKKNKEEISLKEFKNYDDQINQNDIVFIRTGMDRNYRDLSPRWLEEPYPSEEAVLWLIEKKIACFGTDSASVEVPDTDYQPNHQALFKAGIPIVESLTNLEKIENGKYIVMLLPLPIKGLDASPLRVVAVRKDALK